ncbi:hypothetical cytosolic protein [Syntrophus aciditrophicus SB]|uniref:Hypothetical cytosolic protein n=1 Tax=Syntrophus aciditrophicus (strain SB) TaxID=56780 RepID=Q2LVB9_SYNAS|nr:hypothetical cytosolic protein [Syntrophus aciditrophicus SB]
MKRISRKITTATNASDLEYREIDFNDFHETKGRCIRLRFSSAGKGRSRRI